MSMVRVRALHDHTDAWDNIPRAKGEEYDLDEARAQRSVSIGRVELVEQQEPADEKPRKTRGKK